MVVAPLGDSVTTTRAVPEVSAMVLIAASSMYVVDGVTVDGLAGVTAERVVAPEQLQRLGARVGRSHAVGHEPGPAGRGHDRAPAAGHRPR